VVDVSVVIPTYNRLDSLRRVMQALERQRGAPAMEVVVVDDGSADGTSDWLGRTTFQMPVRAVTQHNRGPAAARNRGVELATGRIVALLGDDTIPHAGWLAAHARAHRKRLGPYAVIGYTGWSERVRSTPFLRFVNEHGIQFGYALIENREDVPFQFFYASNVSLPRKLMLAERFDERFPHACWEDTELGYRLMRRDGLRLAYCPEAVTEHEHPMTLRDFIERQKRVGYVAVLFARLHPELGAFLELGPEGPPPLPPRRRLRETAALVGEKLPIAMPAVWSALLRYHYVVGLHRGWADRDRLGVDEGRGTPSLPVAAPGPDRLRVDPYLHLRQDQVYSPILDRALRPSDWGYREVAALVRNDLVLEALPSTTRDALRDEGWLVADEPAMSHRFRLRYVSIKAHATGDRVDDSWPAAERAMPDELYARIVRELSDYRETIEAVFVLDDDGAVADPRLVDRVRQLRSEGLRPAVVTDARRLTPERVDALVDAGGLRFLSVSLCTPEGTDDDDLALRHLDHARTCPVAVDTDLVVVGRGDARHRQHFERVRRRFADSRLDVTYREIVDHAAIVPHRRLCGCENVGSRPLQHLHVTPDGLCVMCSEDASERFPVGDLTKESVAEVLAGSAFARVRRWAYGLETPPDDFTCRRCTFARTR
jgi:glycosyltransferase involved in cell wall biosynthesis